MTATPPTTTDLEDVLQEFLEQVERPDPSTLEHFIGKYPHYAVELTDFAAEWLLEELSPQEELSSEEQNAAVSRALRYLQRHFTESEKPETENGGSSIRPNSLFAHLTPDDFKRLAEILDVDKLVIAKVRDCKLELRTIPEEFTQELATKLKVPVDVVSTHLDQQAILRQGVDFKAHHKPEIGKKQSFREAIESSTMTERQKSKWLSKLK